jgi:hypothetical protein
MHPLLSLGVEPALSMWSTLGYWIHLPILIVVISLVYGGTRFDDWPHILREAWRWVVRLTGFLLVVVAVLFVLALLI